VTDEGCPKVGYNHEIGWCECHPNWGKEGYCELCLTKLRDFTVTTDWPSRRLHKSCWLKEKRENNYRCPHCRYLCNDSLWIQDFCSCQEEEA